jgi:hypothetical protein
VPDRGQSAAGAGATLHTVGTHPVRTSAAHLSGGQHRAAPSTRLPAGRHDAVRVSVTVSAARFDAVRAGARLLSPGTDTDRRGARLLSSGTEPARWGSQLFFTFLLRAAGGARLKSGFLGLSEPRSRHLARVLTLVSAGSRWPPPRRLLPGLRTWHPPPEVGYGRIRRLGVGRRAPGAMELPIRPMMIEL